MCTRAPVSSDNAIISSMAACSAVVGRLSLGFPAALGTGLILSFVWESIFGTGGNLVSDVHLVAGLRQHGVKTIYTCDKDFRKFGGVEVNDPLS